MISKNFILDIFDELMVDNFAGGGGASIGIEMATGRFVNHAINHAWDALGMHRINHPQTLHYETDVFDIIPRIITKGMRVALAWFSPDCKHFSKAKGGKPVSKKIRGLAFVILRWAKYGIRSIYMENVEEIQTWGPLLSNNRPDPKHKGRTWRAFLDALSKGVSPDSPDLDEMLEVLGDTVTREEMIRGFGYNYETRELRACDYGSRTIRKRLYMIARGDGCPIVWPKPTHAPREICRGLGLKPYRAIAECIQWDLPIHSIFLSKRQARQCRCRRPLAKATLRRTARGVDRYILKAQKPFFVSCTHQGGDRIEPIDEPGKTITAAHRGEKALVDARVCSSFLTEHANAENQRNVPVDKPGPTTCAEVKGGHWALVSASICREFGQSIGQAVTDPAPTVMPGGGGKTALITAALTKFNTGAVGSSAEEPAPTICSGSHHPNTHGGAASTLGLITANMVKLRGTNIGSDVGDPIHSMTAGGQHHGLVAAKLGAVNLYYGSEADGQALDESFRTVSTKPRFGLTQAEAIAPIMTEEHLAGARRVAKFLRNHGIEFEGEFATVNGLVIWDICMRMLTPRELFRAQGFPESYVIDRASVFDPETRKFKIINLTKEQQIRMCGNSVCPDVAAALVRANQPELCMLGQNEIREFAEIEREASVKNFTLN
ncbi:MAG TPA: DNA cytosine methyltransferase [Verrucomicrobiae bacterium]